MLKRTLQVMTLVAALAAAAAITLADGPLPDCSPAGCDDGK